MLSHTIPRFVPLIAGACLCAVVFLPSDGAALLAATAVEQPLAAAPATATAVPITKFAADTVDTTKVKPAPAVVAKATAAPVASVPAPKQASLAQPTGQAPTSAAGTAARVGRSSVNLRSAPSLSSARVVVLRPGAAVTVVQPGADWSLVETASGQSGWVSSEYLQMPGSEPVAEAASQPSEPLTAEAKAEAAQYARLSGAVEVRARPSGSAQTLFVLKGGQRVAVLERQGSWLRVAAGSGASGWILTR
jgi:N-acetylmuramoyl-L-alanine amidase